MKKTLLLLIILSALLLCSCGTINLYQKLYRDGSFDLSFEVKSSSPEFLNLMKSSLEKNNNLKAKLIEEENGFKYVFDKTNFRDLPTGNQLSSLESMGFKKEFKFPYYYYTLTLKNKGFDSSDADTGMSASSLGMGLNYIIEPFGKITDTNGYLLGEDKQAVKFNLMITKEYYLTFRDNFISAYFGGWNKLPEREAKEVINDYNQKSANNPNQENKFSNVQKESENNLFTNGMITGNVGKSVETATPIPSTVIAQNTQNGITLMIHSVKAIKKDTDWGKVTNLQFTIKNDNTKTIYSPVLLLFLYNENNSYVHDIEQKAQVRDSVELGSFLRSEDILTKEVSTNAAYNGDMSKPITLKVILADGLYSPDSKVSIEFNIDFE